MDSKGKKYFFFDLAHKNPNLSKIIIVGCKKIKMYWIKLMKCLSNMIRDFIYHFHESDTYLSALCAYLKSE